MNNAIFFSIFFCFLSRTYSEIPVYELNPNDNKRIPIVGNFFMNLSKIPNNEYLFIQINYDVSFDFSNLSYAFKNETNFTNLKNVDFYIKEIVKGTDKKTTMLYMTFQKKDNFKYLLIYFFVGYYLDFTIDSKRNYFLQIPKYGSAYGSYNTLFYMNLTNFNESEIIYIKLQFNTTKNIYPFLKNYQSDYFGRQYFPYTFSYNDTMKKKNITYTYYFQFVKKKKYIYFLADLSYYINVRLINTKKNEYKKDKEKSKGLTKKTARNLIIIVLLSAVVLILLSIYIFVLRPMKKMSSEENEIKNNIIENIPKEI